MKIFIGNAFSLQMLDLSSGNTLVIRPVTEEEAKEVAKLATSCVGHADTAAVMSSQLGFDVLCQRTNVALAEEDQLLVGQFSGGRLPEGATTLPEGTKLSWILVTVVPKQVMQDYDNLAACSGASLVKYNEYFAKVRQ